MVYTPGAKEHGRRVDRINIYTEKIIREMTED